MTARSTETSRRARGRRRVAGLVAAALALTAAPVAHSQQSPAGSPDTARSQAAGQGADRSATTGVPASLWKAPPSAGARRAPRAGSADSGGDDVAWWGALLVLAGLCVGGAGVLVGRSVRPSARTEAPTAAESPPPVASASRRFAGREARRHSRRLFLSASEPADALDAAERADAEQPEGDALAQPAAVGDRHVSVSRARTQRAAASTSGTGTATAVAPDRHSRAVTSRTQRAPTAAVQLQRCALVASRLGRTGEFRVIVKEGGGGYRVVAQSSRFDVPPTGDIPEEGEARDVYREMVACLLAAGWRDAGHGGPWYERVFVRPQPAPHGPAVERSVIVMRAAGEKARFEALLLGEYGSSTSRRVSPSFPTSSGEVEPGGRAQAAHRALLRDLEAEGWHVSGRLEPWYVTTLELRRAPWP